MYLKGMTFLINAFLHSHTYILRCFLPLTSILKALRNDKEDDDKDDQDHIVNTI